MSLLSNCSREDSQSSMVNGHIWDPIWGRMKADTLVRRERVEADSIIEGADNVKMIDSDGVRHICFPVTIYEVTKPMIVR